MMTAVFKDEHIKTFELKDLVDRTLHIKNFIAMKEDNMILTCAIDIETKEMFVLDRTYPNKEMRNDTT